MAKYLIIRLSAIGDVAMTIPVIYSVAKDNPRDSFTILTQEFLIPLFINRPLNIDVIGINTKTTEKGIKGLLRISFMLSRPKYDTVIDLHDVLRTKIIRTILHLKGKKVYVIDKARKERKKLTRRNNKVCEPLRPVIDRYGDTFRMAGLNFTNSFISLFQDIPVEPLITRQKDKHWIGIAPFARHKGKIYPIDKMEQVISELSQRNNTEIFLFGGKGYESEILQKWTILFPNLQNIAGCYSLDKELALISQLDLLISMDSANMHFASLVNTRTISIWGATHPFAGFYGYGQKAEDAIQLSLECRPCSTFGNKACYRGDWACMTQLSHQTIIKKIEEIISGNE